jgi:hypothetical protein
MNLAQTAFVRCLKEEYGGGVESYYKLLAAAFEQANIKVDFSQYSEDKKHLLISYITTSNNIQIKFYEAITIHSKNAIRLSFWSIRNLSVEFQEQFLANFENVFFKSGNNNVAGWQTLWKGKFRLKKQTVKNCISKIMGK